ncbi:MAG: hypothetical protein E3K36_09720 [Candidatus Brocadia sp.]|nr:hypothetical protein [Candidatus Brocadia sp.]
MAEISDKTNEGQKIARKGEKPVGIGGIASIIAYLILFSGLLLYAIITFWPDPSQMNTENPDQLVLFQSQMNTGTHDQSRVGIACHLF